MRGDIVHVAVGIIIDDKNNILIALRHPDAHQGGLWEFPGGKLEQGETVQQALRRELSEELGIEAVIGDAVIEIIHEYEDKSVLLDVWKVKDFTGEVVGKEGQCFRWVRIDELTRYQFPEANEPIVESLINSQGSTFPGVNV